MCRVINTKGCLEFIYSTPKLDYTDIFMPLTLKYTIRVTKIDSSIWFEVGQEPLLEGCYLFSSQDLKETLDWCYDNLKGSFTWGGYVKNTKPDSKFGHTKLEYLTQIPFIGLVFTGVVYAILIVVTYPSILFQQVKEKLNAK